MIRSTLTRAAMGAAALSLLALSAAGAQTPMTPSTKDFAQAAAQSDHFEIVEAQAALAQSHDPGVLAFARQMIPAHTETSRTLRDAVVRAGMEPPPPGLDGGQQKLLGALQSVRGVEFDHAYARQQVLAHQQALVVESAYAAQGADPGVRRAAQAAVPVIQRHLQMAERLRAASGGQ